MSLALLGAMTARVDSSAGTPSPLSGQAGPTPTMRLIEQSGPTGPDDDFVVFVEVSGVEAGSDLAVDLYPAITTQAQLDNALVGKPRSSIATFPVIDLPGDPNTAPIQSGFVIGLHSQDGPPKTGGWAKRLTRPGVYPVRIRLRDATNTTVLTMVTLMVRGPDSNDDRPDQTPIGLLAEIRSPNPATAPGDEILTPEVTAGVSWMAEAASLSPRVPLSVIADPQLARVAATAASDTATDGSNATGDLASSTTQSGDSAPDHNSSDSETEVDALAELTRSDQVEVLASAAQQVDPAELHNLGLDDELARQVDEGIAILTATLEPPVRSVTSVATRLDPETVRSLGQLGFTDILVPPPTFSEAAPSTPARVAGTTAAVRLTAMNPALKLGGDQDPLLAAHVLAGRLAAQVSLDEPRPQVVSVHLPTNEAEAEALHRLLTLLSDDPFTEPRLVSELLADADTAPERARISAPGRFTSTQWADDLGVARSLLSSLAGMVPGDESLLQPLANRLSATTDRRLDSDTRSSEVTGVRNELNALFSSISIPPSDRVTLGANDARFPLVITSNLDTPATVRVQLSSSDRLSLPEPDQMVTLTNDHTEVSLRVRSRLPGDTPLKIRITSPDGAVLLSEGTYSVRSTAVSGVGLILSLGAGLFLAVWWARHIVAARRPKGRHSR